MLSQVRRVDDELDSGEVLDVDESDDADESD